MSQSAIIRLLRYAGVYRLRVVLATSCSVLNKLFDVMPEILIGIAIDVVVRQEDSFVAALGISEPSNQIYLLAFLTFLIWAGESLFEYLYLVLWRNLAQSLQHDLRLDAARHVLDLDMSWFEERSSGGLTAILNDDVNQLERFLNGGANALIQTLTSVVAVGGVFFFISPTIAWLAFTPIPVIIIGAFWFQKRAHPCMRPCAKRSLFWVPGWAGSFPESPPSRPSPPSAPNWTICAGTAMRTAMSTAAPLPFPRHSSR